ncbi:hypothetical protein ACHAXR_007778, partial [Thalassiosira sp. AJA248-18]
DNTADTKNEPTQNDILLGRVGSLDRHPGNVNFRAIVSQYVDAYMNSTKSQKSIIARSIVDKMRNELNPPGRFLAQLNEDGLWHEVDDRRALRKTTHTLRAAATPLPKAPPETEEPGPEAPELEEPELDEPELEEPEPEGVSYQP